MKRWIPQPTLPPTVKRWQSREEILSEYLDRFSPEELREAKPAYYWTRYGFPAWQRECVRKYDPNQPRVPAGNSDGGRWTSGGDGGSRLNDSIIFRSSPAAMSSRAFCEAQWNRDIFHCNMVGLSSCYAQAMVRLVACEKGQPIPPLNY